jgi:hypothetical protein
MQGPERRAPSGIMGCELEHLRSSAVVLVQRAQLPRTPRLDTP